MNPSTVHENVEVNGYPDLAMTVGPNLAAALRQLRKNDTVRTIWIDALSINQSSDRERNYQVALMGQIYSSAEDVYIWLGPHKGHTDLVMDKISTDHFQGHQSKDVMYALELVLGRDWFGRVWVAQELALASRDPIVLCGPNIVRWSHFAATVQVIRARILDETIMPGVRDHLGELKDPVSDRARISRRLKENYRKSHDPDMESIAVASKALRVSKLAEIRDMGDRATLADQIERTLYMQASDPRDRIFALSALTKSSSQKVMADYTKPTEQVAVEVAALLIRHDFVGYMTTRLWEHTRYPTGHTPGYSMPLIFPSTSVVPSFCPELEVLGRRSLNSRFAPPATAIRQIMARRTGMLPIADFTKDCRELMTLGYDMGRVTTIDPSGGGFVTSKNYHGYAPFNDEPPFELLLVGLFGINAPFFLRQTQDEPAKYRILAFVTMSDEELVNHYDARYTSGSVSQHTWGHTFLENAETGEKYPSRYSIATQDLRRWEHMKWFDSLRSSSEADRFKLYVIT